MTTTTTTTTTKTTVRRRLLQLNYYYDYVQYMYVHDCLLTTPQPASATPQLAPAWWHVRDVEDYEEGAQGDGREGEGSGVVCVMWWRHAGMVAHECALRRFESK